MARHVALAHRTAVLFGAGPDADVVQEAFVKAFRSLGAFRRDASFRSWLLSIVVHETSNLRRAGRRREQAGLRLARLPVDEVPGPEGAALAGERRRRLQAGLAGLPERDRVVVTCRYLLELSEAETAHALGWPVGTVKSRLSRALTRLRAELGSDAMGESEVTRG